MTNTHLWCLSHLCKDVAGGTVLADTEVFKVTSGWQSALRGFVLFFKPLSPQLPLHRPWIPSPVENRAACEDPADCLGDSPAGRGQGVF